MKTDTSQDAAVEPRTRISALLSSDWLKVFALTFVFSWFPLQYMYSATVDDPDIWWHMRTGEWILQHHAVPRIDLFSYTGMGRPWVAYSWLFEVVIYKFVAQWDLLGIVIYKALMCIAITAALFHLLRGITKTFWPAVGLTAFGVLTMVRVLTPRPGMFSILLFILTLDILLQTDRTGKTQAMWALPVLFAAWANLHVQFVYGIFAVALFSIEWTLRPVLKQVPAPERTPSAAKLWAVLILSTAATLLNPYGIGVYRVLWEYSQQPALAKLVRETEPMAFNDPINRIVLVLAACALVALLRVRPVRPFFAVLLLWAMVSAFRVERDVWVLVTVACVVIGAAIAKREQPDAPALPRNHQLATGLAVALLMLLGLGYIAPASKQLLARLARVLPMGSVAYIHEHHPTGPIYNDFNWGGFLIYAVPDMPVAMDGRTNIHSAQEIQRSWDTWHMKPGWDSDPTFANANIILGNPKWELTRALMHDPSYHVAFNDGVSVLILKNR